MTRQCVRNDTQPAMDYDYARCPLRANNQRSERLGTIRMIRIGIIGLGWWGKQIVTCLSDSPRFKVVAGCDIDTKMAKPFAATHHFDLTEDYKALLNRPDVDAIAVVTPHLLHEEMA